MHFAGLFIFLCLGSFPPTQIQNRSLRLQRSSCWAEVEPGFSLETVQKYGRVPKTDLEIWLGISRFCEISKTDLLRLKSYWLAKSLSASRQMSLLLAFKRFLIFCRDEKKLQLELAPEEIKPPKRPRREVIFLTPEEIETVLLHNSLNTYGVMFIKRACDCELSLRLCLGRQCGFQNFCHSIATASTLNVARRG